MSRNRLCSWKILVRINGLLKALLRHLYVKTLRMGISMSLDTSQVSIRVIGIMTCLLYTSRAGAHLRGGRRSRAGHPKASSHEPRRERRRRRNDSPHSAAARPVRGVQESVRSCFHHTPSPRAAHPCSPGAQLTARTPIQGNGECKPSFNKPQRTPKRHPPARSGPGLVNRGKHPRTRATRTVDVYKRQSIFRRCLLSESVTLIQ